MINEKISLFNNRAILLNNILLRKVSKQRFGCAFYCIILLNEIISDFLNQNRGADLRLEEIILMLQRNLMFALSATIIICLAFFIVYRFVYLKKFAGDKRLKGKQVIVSLLFIIYIVSVCSLTLVNRGANYEGSVNLALFSSYREAWYDFSVRDWQYIYFNIAMFVPLGFCLPLLSKRFFAIGWTLLAAVLFTGFIEAAQYITGVGIFELDDLFNNILGALIGFGLVKVFIVKRWALRVLSLMPLLLVIVLSLVIFTYYEQKEFGNLAIVPAVKVNMEDARISTTLTFNGEHPVSTVYKAPSLTKDEAQQNAYKIFRNLKVDTSSIEIIDYQNEANYRYQGEPAYFIWLHFLDGSYELTDFSMFDVERADTDEQTLVLSLQEMGITIPATAQFERMDVGQYEWRVNQFETGGQLIDGTLKVAYYQDKTIKSVVNNIITYEKVREIKLKSEQQAYNELLDGKFKTYDKNIKEMQIQQVKQAYELDSKGFYQPIYVFSGTINGEEGTISIPGIE